MPVRMLCQPSRCSPKGVDTRRCASKDALSTFLLFPKGGILKGVGMRRCASKDTGPKGGWIWGRSHIDWRKERVPARTLAPLSHTGWRGEQTSIYKGVETFSQTKIISASGGSGF